MHNITWKVEASVTGGPSQSVTSSVDVEAYGQTSVDIAGNAVDAEVETGANTGDVHLLFVTASRYTDPLTFKVNAAGNPEHTLDGPLLLVGGGGLGLIAPAVGDTPTSLLFTNPTADDVTVELIVGRDATP